MDRRPPYTELSISAASSGDNTLIPAVSNHVLEIFKIWFVVASDVTIVFKHGSTAYDGPVTMKAGGSFVLDEGEHPWFGTAVNEAFILNLSGAVQVSGRIYYRNP